MKFKDKRQSKVNWKKIAIVVMLVGIAAYQWYSENRTYDGAEVVDVEEYLDQYEAPGTSQANSATQKDSAEEQDSTKAEAGQATTSKERDPRQTGQKDSGQDYLKAIGGGRLQSPEGLIYAKGRGEHRVDHVMRHIRDDPTRPVHGVFKGDRETVLKLIDEAYGLIKEDSKYVKAESSQGNTAYTVSMGKKVGYEGGQKGQRNGNRELRKIRLVLDGNKVITAYPYR